MSGGHSYDFAVMTSATVDLDHVSKAEEGLLKDLGKGALLSVELFGRSAAGDLIVFFHFAFSAYSAALRKRMEREGERLKGRVVELALLPKPERDRFEALVAGFDVRPAPGDLAQAIRTVREKMGLSAAHVPAAHLNFGSEEEILAAYARYVAEGSFFIATPRKLAAGSKVRLLFIAPGLEPLEATAQVTQAADRDGPGVLATIDPSQAFKNFLTRKTFERRQGRASGGATGKRQSERFEACLEVIFDTYPELMTEFGSNISRGGMFVKTYQPPPLRSKVKLTVRLPDGAAVEVEAEVVHVVPVDDALAKGAMPGVGLSFLCRGELDARLSALLEKYRARKPRVLVVNDDDGARPKLAEALTSAGMEVLEARDSGEAMDRLTDGLFALDLMVLDLKLSGLDSTSLLWRIRKLGGEADLRVVVLGELSVAPVEQLKALGATEVVARTTPLPELVAHLKALVGV